MNQDENREEILKNKEAKFVLNKTEKKTFEFELYCKLIYQTFFSSSSLIPFKLLFHRQPTHSATHLFDILDEAYTTAEARARKKFRTDGEERVECNFSTSKNCLILF